MFVNYITARNAAFSGCFICGLTERFNSVYVMIFLITLCTPREVGVNLKQGYNGDLTAKQAGSIGGQMVNNICPVRHMKFTRNYRWITGHEKQLTYSFRLTV